MRRLGPDPEILIVGAGPAGSTLAGLLAREGRDVLLVDRARFPREKACGECLNPGAVMTLQRLGLLSVVEAIEPFPIEGWDLLTPSGVRAQGRFGPRVGGALGIRRGPFDQALLEVARSRGARVEEGIHVQSVEVDRANAGKAPTVHGRWVGAGRTAWSLRPRIVVGADGLRSVVARSVGASMGLAGRKKASLSWHLDGPEPDSRVGHLLLGGPFTSGLAPVGRSSIQGGRTIWSQTVVVDPESFGARLRTDPDDLRREALELLLPHRSTDFHPLSPPRASGPFDTPTRWAARGSVFLVGDAAGYFDPLTGQGIFRALRSAELALPLLLEALETHPVPPDRAVVYDRALRGAFAPGRRLQKVIDLVLERPLLRKLGVGALRMAPGRTDVLIGITGDRIPVRSLVSPGRRRPTLDPPNPMLEPEPRSVL